MPQRRNRRAQLADAAVEVLARDGGRGLTHRAVDREAGFPEGTTKNYFPTRSALFLAVARYLAAQHTEALDALCNDIPPGLSSEDITALYAAMLRRI